MQESETLRKDGGALSNKRPPRILVVDDDSRLRDLLRQFLTNNGFHVSVAENAEQMNRLWLRERFDAVVLDVMMPGEDGISILKRIRASNDTTPILMLTAKGEDIDRILGLELGADDYLPKPYNPRELLARLHAILRRREPVDPPGAPSTEDEVVRFGNFSLDLGTRKLSKGDEEIPLTTGEFAVLKTFARHPRFRFPRQADGNGPRPQYEAFDRSLDVQVSLRKIIGPDPSKPRYLQTVWGLGYVFIPDGASDAQDKK
ncbi:MAG: two-component system response regulator OmpR [Parasutterella sp.]